MLTCSPSLAINYSSDGARSYPKSISEFSDAHYIWNVVSPDFLHHFCRKFMSGAFLSMVSVMRMRWSRPHTFSFYRIPRVLFMRSEVKMIWSYTGWIVAFMQHPKSHWDFTVGENPRNSMGVTVLSMVRKLSVRAFGFLTARPIPTSCSFVNPIPKLSLKSGVGVFYPERHNPFVMLVSSPLVRMIHATRGNMMQPNSQFLC